MPKVNVVLPSGRVVSVDQELAATPGALPVESPATAEERARRENVENAFGGVSGAVGEAFTSAADTLTLGGFGAAANAIGGDTMREAQRNAAETNPGGRLVGELGAMILTPEELGLGLAGRAGEIGGSLARGAVYGLGGTISSANVSGDPLTIEALLEGATIGGVMDFGVSALAGGLGRAGQRVEASAEGLRSGERASEVLNNDSAAWNELRDARIAADAEATAHNAKVVRDTARYEEYLGDRQKFDRVANGFENAVNDMRAELRKPTLDTPADLSERIARAQNATARARELYKSGEAAAADAELRGAYEHLSPSATRRVPQMPALPGEPVPVNKVDVPADLAGFARMHPETVAKWANSMSQPEKDALLKLHRELGLEPGATASGSLADAHSGVRDLAAAIKKDSEASPLIKMLKYGAGKAARAAVGGVLGAASHVPGGTLIGEMVGASLPAGLMNGGSIAAKIAMRERIAAVISAAARGTEKMAPVTAYLSRGFPSGPPDTESDIRARASKRAREIRGAAVTVPDTAFAALQHLAAAPGAVGPKLHGKTVQMVRHLAAALPPDPGISNKPLAADQKLSLSQSVDLAARLEAAQAPLDAIRRIMAGESHPGAIDTLWSQWPAMLNEASGQIVGNPGAFETKGRELSTLLRAPVQGLSDPRVVTHLQGMFLPSGQGPNPTSSSLPGGRPPATGHVPLAGSNVSALLTQGQR